MKSLIPLWKDFEYKSHQISGIEWMLEQEEDALLPGGFLCDEMGLGKTIEILGLIKNSEYKRTLMIAPLAVLMQWRTAAERSKFNVFVVNKKNHRWESTKTIYINRPSLYVINYECAIGHQNLVEAFRWDRIVYDEAHRLINAGSKLHVKISEIQAKTKWIVTATPIVNGLPDIKALFTLLGLPKEKMPYSKDAFLPLVQQKMLCRRVDELRPVIPELPKKETTHVHTLPFQTKEEEEFYRSIQGKLVERLNVLMEEGSDQWAILKLLLLLRQISVHPQIYINARKRDSPYYSKPDWKGDSTKFAHLKKLLQQDSGEQHRWLVFCHFHDEMEILRDTLADLPRIRRVQIYSGKLSQEQRDEIIQRTKEPLTDEATTEVLVVQLQSGSVGLNLQHFDRVVFLSPWWTAALMDQAVGRAVRIGQTEQVHVHHFRLEEEKTMNIDKLMLEKVESKRDLCDWFLDNANRGIEEEDDENPKQLLEE